MITPAYRSWPHEDLAAAVADVAAAGVAAVGAAAAA
jgi:hypothetical protein